MRELDLETVLRRLIAAEERFVNESGVPLDDAVGDAVAEARKLLGLPARVLTATLKPLT